jgi:hypothetical protein
MMMHATKRLVWGGLLATGVVMMMGCERGPSRPAIDESAIVGKWVEVVEQAAPSPRMRARAETKYVRHLTINADKTFEFALHTKSGEPTNLKSEGTWAVEEKVLVFNVTDSTIAEKDERRAWAPESSDGVREKDIAGEGLIEVMETVDLEGMVVDYKRTT